MFYTSSHAELLFWFVSSSCCANVFLVTHFKFLLCRRFCSCSFHLPRLQNLLILFISPSSRLIFCIFVCFTFIPCCCSLSSHLPPMQKFLFISSYAYAEVVILFNFTFFLCRSGYSYSFHFHLIQKLLFSFILPSFNPKVLITFHASLFRC